MSIDALVSCGSGALVRFSGCVFVCVNLFFLLGIFFSIAYTRSKQEFL